MGCSSSFLMAVDDRSSFTPSKAMVVAPDGSLLEYNGGIHASEIILAFGQGFTLSNSDNISFDAYPPAMALDERLVPQQIYFLLPVTELNQRLSGDNVAVLAIRASTAMKQASKKQGRMRIRVVPVMEIFDVELGESGENLDLRLATPTTKMKKMKGTTMIGSKGSRRFLSTIEEANEETINCQF